MEKAADPRSANLYLSHVRYYFFVSLHVSMLTLLAYRYPYTTPSKMSLLSFLLLPISYAPFDFSTKAISQASVPHLVLPSKELASSVSTLVKWQIAPLLNSMASVYQVTVGVLVVLLSLVASSTLTSTLSKSALQTPTHRS